MARPGFKGFRKKALERTGVCVAFDELTLAYELRKKLVEIRKDAGLTQAEVAAKLLTQKSNISRLESASSTISPRLSTIADYARAVGFELKIDFVRRKPGRNKAE